MSQFIPCDAFSSLKNFSNQKEVFSSKFGEDLDQATFKFKTYADECASLFGTKEHQNLPGHVEDELPKFHFPPKEFELFGNQETKQTAPRSTDGVDTDSVHSQTSTRANLTKDLVGHEDDILSSPYFDIMSPAAKVEPVQQKPKETLPTLDQIFNLKSNPNFNGVANNGGIAKPGASTVAASAQAPRVDVNKQVAKLTTTGKPAKAKQDLSKRGDVVNKTILRAMKRYYFTEFDSMFNFTSMSDKEKFANFQLLIRKFVTQEMKATRNLTEEEQEEAILFFGSMISHVHMRRGITVSKMRTQVNFVHKCLYNYSHKKLSQLMQQGGFKFILDDFVNFDGIEVVLNSEETMLKQPDLYRDACQELLLTAQE
jgi:hypothetical protein